MCYYNLNKNIILSDEDKTSIFSKTEERYIYENVARKGI